MPSPVAELIPGQFTIRQLHGESEYRAFENLQRETWGKDLAEVISGSLAGIVQKIGGIAAGAFNDHGELVGLVFGLTGYQDGRPVHWSHMLAVSRNVRDRGLGMQLKRYQRDQLLEQGIEQVYWTFDPLVAKNALLNLNNLGARPVEYVKDMYGAGEDSDLFRGIGTDRFVVLWQIASPGVKARLAGKDVFNPVRFSEALAIVRRADAADRDSPPILHDLQTESSLRIEIPEDIHALLALHPEKAMQWREATRQALLRSFKERYRIAGFLREEGTHRCYYCLEKGSQTP